MAIMTWNIDISCSDILTKEIQCVTNTFKEQFVSPAKRTSKHNIFGIECFRKRYSHLSAIKRNQIKQTSDNIIGIALFIKFSEGNQYRFFSKLTCFLSTTYLSEVSMIYITFFTHLDKLVEISLSC
jgi:hypothetical protein